MDQHDRDVYAKDRERLIDRARQAAMHATNHRGFLVGCVVLAWSSRWGEGRQYRLFGGANMMPLRDGPKICAELVAMGAALAAGAEKIVAIVVAGDPQKDDQSGMEMPTLHPCWICRTMLRHLPGVEDDTIVLTVCNGEGPTEEFTFAKLLSTHNGGSHTT